MKIIVTKQEFADLIRLCNSSICSHCVIRYVCQKENSNTNSKHIEDFCEIESSDKSNINIRDGCGLLPLEKDIFYNSKGCNT